MRSGGDEGWHWQWGQVGGLCLFPESQTRLREAPSIAYEMLAAMVVVKSFGSWETTPICERNHWASRLLRGVPSSRTLPLTGS